MSQSRRQHVVSPSLNRDLLWLGIPKPLLLASAGIAAAVWIFGSVFSALPVFFALCFFSWWLTARDPARPAILWSALRGRALYDPFEPEQFDLPLRGFLADGRTFLTKTGDCGVVLEAGGVDPDSLDQVEVNRLAERFEVAFRSFDSRTLFQEIYFRRDHAPLAVTPCGNAIRDRAARSRTEHLAKVGLYEEELYYVLLYLDRRAERSLVEAIRNQEPGPYLRRRKHQELIASEVQENRDRVNEKANEFIAQLRDVMPMRMIPAAEAFRVMYRLLNFGPCEAPIFSPGERLDQRLADSFIAGGGDHHHLIADDRHMIVLALKSEPAKTWPLMFRDVQKLAGEFQISTTWKPQANALKDVRKKKEHHFAGRNRGIQMEENTTRERLRDGVKLQDTEDLEALERRLARGETSGHYTLTCVVHDLDLARARRTAEELTSVCARAGATLIPELYGQANALFATLPGGYRRLHRKRVLMSSERADLALWSIASGGEEWNSHLGAESLAVLRTSDLTPYHLNLHVEDVAHTIVTGSTGAGKSTFVAWVVACLRKYDPVVAIVDPGGSFEGVVEAFGGHTARVVPGDPSFRVNPFAHALTPEHHEFLALFVSTLAESDGGPKLTGAQSREIFDEVRNLYGLGPELRTLNCLSKGLAKATRERLQPWVRGGQHGELFDNVEDSLTFSDLQYFNFPKQADPRVMAAVLLHVFQGVNEVVLDPALSGRLKVLVIDEGEIFARNPQLCVHIVEAVKTWRKSNGAVIWMGQSIDALLADAETERSVLRPLVQSCATQIFLSNPSVDGDYTRLFGLSPEQVEAVRGLRGKDEVLLKQGDRIVRLSTSLDPVNLLLAATSAQEKARRAEAFRKYGPLKALDILTKEDQ